MTQLLVTDLAVARGGVPVLEGVSFAVPAGQALILRGPNGAGKTTLLRCLAGLQPAISGHIEGAGEDAAYASHADGIKSQLSVTENLRFWAELHGERLDDQVFRDFALHDLRDRAGGELSAGQKRRLGLARLAVTGRRVMLLDEPTVSLDAASVAAFATWIAERHLAHGGIAVIATHIDLGLSAPVLDIGQFRASADAKGGSDEAFL